MRLRDRRSGVTLLEMMIALLVIGLTVASGRAIADQVAGSGRATFTALDARLEELGRTESLRRVVVAASAPRDSSEVFDGTQTDFVLSTRCLDARGIEGRCRCRITVRSSVPLGSILERRCNVGSMPDTLESDSVGLGLIYLVDASRGGRWLHEWRKTNSLPIAIGVIHSSLADTLVLRIGERG